MKHLLTAVFLFLTLASEGQRRRALQPSESIPWPEPVTGQLIQVQIANSDSVPIYVRFAPFHRPNGDTIKLAKIYSCTDDSKIPYYDLDYLASEENNCVRWYSLQMVNPGDTLSANCLLKNFGVNDSTRLYIGYTSKISSKEREACLFSNPNVIYIMKEHRDFEWTYIDIQKTAPNNGVWLYGGLTNKCSTSYRYSATYPTDE